MAEFRRGRRLAIDWGKARVGIAACDPDGLLCHPVTTLASDDQIWPRLAQLIAEYEPIELVLGMPLNLAGKKGPAAEYMAQIADQLKNKFDLELRVIDERLSTASAARKLTMAGRSAKKQRQVIDQQAAVDILNQAIEYEKRTGEPAGQIWGQEG